MDNISQLNKLKSGTFVTFQALLCTKERKEKTDTVPYVYVTVQDSTGTAEFPIWKDYDLVNNSINTNVAYTISGTVSFWEKKLQIKNPSFCAPVKSKDIDFNLFVPTYDIPKELFEYFGKYLESMEEPYKTIAKTMVGYEGLNDARWKAFITCPSAQKHHGNKRGGLFIHEIGVMKSIDSMIKNYLETPYFYDASKVINASRLRLKAIAHDYKKVDEYEYEGAIKYKSTKKTDHLVDGAAYVREINKECGNILSAEDEEDIAYSILSHHGQWGGYEPKSLEDWLLHIADLTDARIVGETEKQ